MRKPNFFIIGAPKCGTTSLANWLATHPQVFLPSVKEPHFFNFDYAYRLTNSLRQYEDLFIRAEGHHIAVGEASVRYLYSRTAVPAIIGYATQPRFIVMVRNPVEMAYSLHQQTVFNCDEDEFDFSRAWQLQARRAYGDCVPKRCHDPQMLLYGRLCQVGEQVRRLLTLVPRANVLVLNLDFVRRNARGEYLRVLEFLGLDDDGRGDFPVANAAKRRRYPGAWLTVRWANRTLQAAGVPRIRLGVTSFLGKHDRREVVRPEMDPKMQAQLREYFQHDVALLEKLTEWDLTAWKEGLLVD
jgi:hypothetical protein